MMTYLSEIHCGDARSLPLFPERAQTCVTSPPYWGLRSYGTPPQIWGGEKGCVHEWDEPIIQIPQTDGTGEKSAKQITNQGSQGSVQTQHLSSYCSKCRAWRGHLGNEPSPDQYVANLVEVFKEVWRVLKPDGTVWLNLGDCYAAHPGQRKTTDKIGAKQATNAGGNTTGSRHVVGLKPKDLVGIPWRVAFALQSDGWYLRSDIIWAKPNPMPESVRDRPTRSHEYLFLLSKQERYYFDQDAIREPNATGHRKDKWEGRTYEGKGPAVDDGRRNGNVRAYNMNIKGRNKRDVWAITPKPYRGAHFATFPPDLVRPCILAGSREGDLVLDPFGGSGTVGLVAQELGRRSLLMELNPEYCELARRRLNGERERAQSQTSKATAIAPKPDSMLVGEIE